MRCFFLYSSRSFSAFFSPASRWTSLQVLLLCQIMLHFPHHSCLHALHTSAGLSFSAPTYTSYRFALLWLYASQCQRCTNSPGSSATKMRYDSTLVGVCLLLAGDSQATQSYKQNSVLQTQVSPRPATATPSQLGCGHCTRSAQELTAALRLRFRYCFSSSAVSSRGTSASRVQHQALGPFGSCFARPASCNVPSIGPCDAASEVWVLQLHKLALQQDAVANVVSACSASSLHRHADSERLPWLIGQLSLCREDAMCRAQTGSRMLFTVMNATYLGASATPCKQS